MKEQVDARDRALAGGAKPLGWKIGINAPPVMEKLAISAPIVGHLTSERRLRAGADCDLSAATFPGLEPEVAIHVSRDVGGSASSEEAIQAIGSIGCALEVVDIDLPFDDLEAIVAGNVFHRAVLLGPADVARPGDDLSGSGVAVMRGGEELARAPALPTFDELARTTAHVAHLLASQGQHLRAGEVIIAGSLTKVIAVKSGETLDVDFGALGGLSITFV